MPKIQENERLNQLVQNYYESENKILPVVIGGSNTSLTQAFLLSLQRTLSEYDLLSSMPETNYKAAIEVIRRWEKEFPGVYTQFVDEIDTPISVFMERLENYDVIAYESFERIYPSLTAGSVFNPFLGFDVVDLYESVAKSLKERGYTGIYVIYDEFSKFLEANIVDASVSDTKMLQDFAEKCCRSGELQLHLMLISHKEISNYIDKLPKEKTDGWRGVSERFKHLHMNNNFTQTYEIISSVIQHNELLWDSFCDAHRLDFKVLFTRYKKHQIFTDEQGEFDTAIKGCFPLHPVSTFILPRLSERVAQNERTLFTFLSAEGTATFRIIYGFRIEIYDRNENLVLKRETADQAHSINTDPTHYEPIAPKVSASIPQIRRDFTERFSNGLRYLDAAGRKFDQPTHCARKIMQLSDLYDDPTLDRFIGYSVDHGKMDIKSFKSLLREYNAGRLSLQESKPTDTAMKSSMIYRDDDPALLRDLSYYENIGTEVQL